MLDLNYIRKNEKDIYATGLVVGYIIGMNKGTLEEMVENFCSENDDEYEAWIAEVESKIQDIESELPETIGFEMAEKMFNEFVDKVRGN